MTASQAIRHAGSMRALGRILGVSHQSVRKWTWRGIPKRQLTRLQEMRPEWFKRGRNARP
jgi:transposase-like protein